MVQERRIGVFRMDRILLDRCSQDDLLSLASNFLIVRAEHMLVGDYIEYTAYSPLFEPVSPACIPPHYLIQIDADGSYSAIKG